MIRWIFRLCCDVLACTLLLRFLRDSARPMNRRRVTVVEFKAGMDASR